MVVQEHIRLNNGNIEFIENNEDFFNLIEREMGKDAREYAEELELGTYDNFNDTYDERKDVEREQIADEIICYIQKAVDYIKNTKILKRNTLIKILHNAQQVYITKFMKRKFK